MQPIVAGRAAALQRFPKAMDDEGAESFATLYDTRFHDKADGEKLTADVTDRIHDALSRAGLVLGADIEEVRIAVSSQRTAGRVTWEYTYRNLRTAAEARVTSGT